MDRIDLSEEHSLTKTKLPPELRISSETFEALWLLHPAEYHEIVMAGRRVKTPRWQQAYGADYRYTGRINKALPVDPLLRPVHEWAKATIDSRLNGLLLNWYDPAHEHYIGKHRDSTSGMVEGAPIVTISLAGERVFRLRPWRGDTKRRIDVVVGNGDVLVMPYAVNLAWTHEVPHRAADRGRRISITLRAFAAGKVGESPT